MITPEIEPSVRCKARTGVPQRGHESTGCSRTEDGAHACDLSLYHHDAPDRERHSTGSHHCFCGFRWLSWVDLGMADGSVIHYGGTAA